MFLVPRPIRRPSSVAGPHGAASHGPVSEASKPIMRLSFPWAPVAIASALCSLPAAAAAQNAVVSGRVWSAEGTPLEDVTVELVAAGDSVAQSVAHTDELGYFAFRAVPPGAYVTRFVLLGYADVAEEVVAAAGRRAEIEAVLSPAPIALEGIVVEAERSRVRMRFEDNAGTTVQDISRQSIKSVPGVAESDPLRAVEVLPGVTTVSDISSSFNVRGGSADQNLILLDGVPILSPFHLGGFFSVFNADMIRRAELRSGGFPAEYGGRVSSVLLLDSDVGDGELGVDAGVSLLASRVAVNGSLPGGMSDRLGLASARWRVSGRRSYVDVVLRPWTNVPYSLQDLQSVFEGWTKGGNRFRFTAYLGGDRLDGRDGLGNASDPGDGGSDPFKIVWSWGNKAIGGSWTRPMTGGGALELRTSFSQYASDLSFPDFEDAEFTTSISETIFGADLERRPTPRTRWKSGLAAKRAWYDNRIQDRATGIGGPSGAQGEGWELSGYSQLHWEPNPGWLLEAGVRVDHWRPGQGPDETTASPRLAAKRFLEGRRSAVRLSLGRYTQFLHSRRNEELPLGLDVWLLAGDRAPRTVSDQVQVGFERFFGEDEAWFGSAEGYYRTFDGVITRNFADDPNDPTDDLLAGRGRAYGLDLFVKRDQGATTGWLSLSLMRTNRTFRDTRSGLDPQPEITFPPVFAQEIDLDLVLQRSLGWELEAGLRFNFSVGRPYTRPRGAYAGNNFRALDGRWDYDDFSSLLLGPRNGDRYPSRHRLDVSLRKAMRWEWGRVTPYVSVLNLYNRKNPLFYFFEYNRNPPTRQGLSMTPLLPTIGVEMSFR